jgi:hypothetical protein
MDDHQTAKVHFLRIVKRMQALLKEDMKTTYTEGLDEEGIDKYIADFIEQCDRNMLAEIEDAALRFRVATALGCKCGDGPGLPEA